MKKENKGEEMAKEEPIDNDFKGLFNYLTAANIRDKVKKIKNNVNIYVILLFYFAQVKHPLFLALYFPRSLRLLYNTKILDSSKVKSLLLVIFLRKLL